MTDLFVLTLLCGLATYLWRALAVVLSVQLGVDTELFRWIECIAYAMVAGLIARIVLMPTGTLAASPLADRIIASVIVIGGYWLFRRNLLAGMGAGVAYIVAATYVRATLG